MALTVDQFCVVPAIIANTDLVATVLRRKAERLGVLENPDLVVRLLPLPPVEAMLLWHPSMTHHKAHRWMREILVDSCRALEAVTCSRPRRRFWHAPVSHPGERIRDRLAAS